MKTISLQTPDDLQIELPELGVSVLVDGRVLQALARRAHNNLGKRAKSGPCSVRVTGVRPDMFNNRFSVHYQYADDGRHTRGCAVSNATRGQAEEVFRREVEKGGWTYVELRGPVARDDHFMTALKTHGTKKEE